MAIDRTSVTSTESTIAILLLESGTAYGVTTALRSW